MVVGDSVDQGYLDSGYLNVNHAVSIQPHKSNICNGPEKNYLWSESSINIFISFKHFF